MRSSVTTFLITASLALCACGTDTPTADSTAVNATAAQTKTANPSVTEPVTPVTTAENTINAATAQAKTADLNTADSATAIEKAADTSTTDTTTVDAPTTDELTLALNTKLKSDHKNIEARIKTMEPTIDRRKLKESLETQRDQQFTVKQINECVVLANTEPQQLSCNVFLDISTKYQKNSQTRHVLMNVSKTDGLWVMNKLSLAPRR
jgi:hypothetical protein